jgi:salicylate hydroxylase
VARARTILIAGAGIGGLAAAIALARAGFRPLVLERARQLAEIGAGIQLTPNASRALDRLGVLGAVRKRAVAAKRVIVGDGRSGSTLAESSLADAEARFGAPWLVTLRADLQHVLLEAAQDIVDIEIMYSAEVTDFAAHARGTTALVTRNGKSEEEIGIGLIGADGLWSKMRERLHGERAPVFHNLVAWRALLPARDLPPAFSEPVTRLWLGPKAHLVHYPVNDGTQINVVAIFRDAWRAESWNEPATISEIPKLFERWSHMPRDLLAAAKSFQRWALADREPLKRWGEGRVTLLGDAAHPTLPTLAQGAGAALEDAVAIARHLAHRDDPADAFRSYEAERAERTARMQRGARFNARIYHAGGPLRWARDLKLRWDGEKLIDRNAWIYRYRPS